ncbi:MAG: hypothetical protein WAW96_10160, partial [Alphaproteobacteria bacterium]
FSPKPTDAIHGVSPYLNFNKSGVRDRFTCPSAPLSSPCSSFRKRSPAELSERQACVCCDLLTAHTCWSNVMISTALTRVKRRASVSPIILPFVGWLNAGLNSSLAQSLEGSKEDAAGWR